MQHIKFYGGLVIGIGFTLFALQNMQSTQVRVLLWYADLPLVVIMLASAAVGAIWASLWIALARRRKARQMTDASTPSDLSH